MRPKRAPSFDEFCTDFAITQDTKLVPLNSRKDHAFLLRVVSSSTGMKKFRGVPERGRWVGKRAAKRS